MRKLFILAAAALLIGCGQPSAPENPNHLKIRDWQAREAHCQSTQEITDGLTDQQAVLDAVLTLVNSIPIPRYEADADGDYWKTSAETEADMAGDCEDQSAYYYRALRGIVPDFNLFIRIYRKTDGSYHAVVVVRYDDGELIVDQGLVFAAMRGFESTSLEYDLWSIF